MAESKQFSVSSYLSKFKSGFARPNRFLIEFFPPSRNK